MIQTWKTRFIFTLLIGLATTIVVSLLSTSAIAWYFKPPVDFGVNCTEAVRWGMNRLQTFQLVGLILGCVVGLALTYRVGREQGKKEKDL